MNLKIDLRSAVMGLSLGLLLAVGVAATTPSTGAVGRYQIVSNPNNGGQGGSHSLILDTQTGKVWLGYVSANGKSDDSFFAVKTGDN
jgi:hypothetical protein